MKRFVRNIVKRGGSLAVNIPSAFVKELDLKVGDPVLITLDGKQLIIEGIDSVETSSRTVKMRAE